MSEEENITRTVTLVLPKKANDFLEAFARAAGETVENILKEEILGVLDNFYDGAFYEKWTAKAKESAKGIQKEIQEHFDC